MRLRSAVPTFVVSNVDETATWYVQELGFRCFPFPDKPPYVFACLTRDDTEIMLMRIVGYQKPDLTPLRPEGLWDAYIRMSGVAEYYEVMRDKPYIQSPLTKRPYGDTEFEVRDPNGYILVFSG